MTGAGVAELLLSIADRILDAAAQRRKSVDLSELVQAHELRALQRYRARARRRAELSGRPTR